MKVEKYKNHNTSEDFILDKDFMRRVLHPSEYREDIRNSLVSEYPEKKELIEDAIVILRSLQPVSQKISEQRLDELFSRIKMQERKSKQVKLSFLKYAAGVAMIIGLGTLLYLFVQNKTHFPIAAGYPEASSNGKVILADGTSKEYNTKEIRISQTNSKNLVINNDTVKLNNSGEKTSLNHVIIPYGTRSQIILADGTKIWLNSGSQLSYPVEFSENSREVYLIGEAFFDVNPNPEKPFYVKTSHVKIKVLGTSFNVSAYPDEENVEAVLVSGKITAGKNKLFTGTIDLSPGERITYNKNEADIIKDKVDVGIHSAWIKGYLIFKNTPWKTVFTELERYYNQPITYDKKLEQTSFSGKLVLKDSLKEVLNSIAFASSLTIEDTGLIYIKPNND